MLITKLPCVEWCCQISILQHRLILYILYLRQSAAKNVSRMKCCCWKRTSWLGQGSSWEPPWCKCSWSGLTAQSGCCESWTGDSPCCSAAPSSQGHEDTNRLWHPGQPHPCTLCPLHTQTLCLDLMAWFAVAPSLCTCLGIWLWLALAVATGPA